MWGARNREAGQLEGGYSSPATPLTVPGSCPHILRFSRGTQGSVFKVRDGTEPSQPLGPNARPSVARGFTSRLEAVEGQGGDWWAEVLDTGLWASPPVK